MCEGGIIISVHVILKCEVFFTTPSSTAVVVVVAKVRLFRGEISFHVLLNLLLYLYCKQIDYNLPGGAASPTFSKSSGLVSPGVNMDARTLEGGLITEPRKSLT